MHTSLCSHPKTTEHSEAREAGQWNQFQVSTYPTKILGFTYWRTKVASPWPEHSIYLKYWWLLALSIQVNPLDLEYCVQSALFVLGWVLVVGLPYIYILMGLFFESQIGFMLWDSQLPPNPADLSSFLSWQDIIWLISLLHKLPLRPVEASTIFTLCYVLRNEHIYVLFLSSIRKLLSTFYHVAMEAQRC